MKRWAVKCYIHRVSGVRQFTMVQIDSYQFNDQWHEPDLNRVFQTGGAILSTTILTSLDHQDNEPGSWTGFKFFYVQILGEQNAVSITNCEVLMAALDKEGNFFQMDQKDVTLINDALHTFSTTI